MIAFKLRHGDILTVDQFNIADLEIISKTAQHMERVVQTKGTTEYLKNRVMTALFYEPSSRTFGSFVSAMQRLGGTVIPIQGVTFSSVSKGETLVDTVRTFACYSDVIVLRHPEVGSAKVAAEFCDKPLINAGDGVGEHPTQALLDFYTIQKHFRRINGLCVTLVGDLLNGRTVHSLVKLLSLFSGVTFQLVSPEILRLPPGLTRFLKTRDVKIVESEELESSLPHTDVLYVTRVQKERFTDLESYERLKRHYVITPRTLGKMKQEAIVMHPLPRVGEIAMDVDLDHRAVYITEQMRNGMYVRMALLCLILGRRAVRLRDI